MATPATSASAGMPAAPPLHAGSDAPAMPAHVHDPCIDREPAAVEDAALKDSNPEVWMSPQGDVELLLPKSVVAWMDARLFREGHDAWHVVRKCGFTLNLPGLPAASTAKLCDMPEFKPEVQECMGPSDGHQFLLAHKHMIQVLVKAFPTHADLFAAFPTFPYDAKDVPEQWRGRFGTGWSQQAIDMAKTLEDIENNMNRFPTEGDLGSYIQCGGTTNMAASIHAAMHLKWLVNGSPAVLGDQRANLANYMFWKLHGWIDKIWDRWRAAKGLPDNQPEHVAALANECRLMHKMAEVVGPGMSSTAMPLPKENGYFHESVRPILEQHCAGCHSGTSAEAGLVLGGSTSSSAIVSNLVNIASTRGGQFKRVLAGAPDQSWFYLKPAGLAEAAGCMGMCNAQVMPPTGGMVTLTQMQLDTIEKWIMDGAAKPMTPPAMP